ncbi:MAG: M23 family metallopeptidase [Desulfobacter sp.]|nr:MAG: M23 family metallopeptidase [Desulfobacter sp.]
MGQGEIIGFVGMTGYATGPHLCFRMKKDGAPIDPLTHKSPPATPVNPDEMKQFLAKTQQLFKQLLMAGNAQDKLSV